MPDRELTEDDATELFDQFLAHYESTYGEGTAWKGVPASLINYSVTVTGTQQDRPEFVETESAAQAENLVRETREVFLPGERRLEQVPVIDDASFTVGTKVEGPAIIDAVDTTIYVPPGTSAERDQYLNYVLTR
jgi:N-methylhydantoinase A